jgi:hypothetical protein
MVFPSRHVWMISTYIPIVYHVLPMLCDKNIYKHTQCWYIHFSDPKQWIECLRFPAPSGGIHKVS